MSENHRSIADLAKLDAGALLQAARRAGVSVTVDCQRDGIFVNDRQVPGDPRGVPADVAPDLLAVLSARVDELKPLLEAAGWWSCGCEQRRLPEDEVEDEFDQYQSTH